MDLDATQPLDLTVWSVGGRTAVPGSAPSIVLAHPTPLGAPTRRRFVSADTALQLAPDSQANIAESGAASAPLASKSLVGAPDDDECELLPTPRSILRPQDPLSKGTACGIGTTSIMKMDEERRKNTHERIVAAALEVPSGFTLDVRDDKKSAALLSTSSSLADAGAETVGELSLGKKKGKDDVPFSIEPTLQVCHPPLNLSDERPIAEPSAPPTPPQPPELKKPCVGDLPNDIAKPCVGDSPNDEFKTPERPIPTSQDDAPLVPRRVGLISSSRPAISDATPSKRKLAVPSPVSLVIGEKVECKWGGGWFPATLIKIPCDGLTVDVQWTDGKTETVPRTAVRAPRYQVRLSDTSKRERAPNQHHHPTDMIPKRPSQPYPSARSEKRAITSSTQLVAAIEAEKCPSPYSPLASDTPATGRPSAAPTEETGNVTPTRATKVLTPDHRSVWQGVANAFATLVAVILSVDKTRTEDLRQYLKSRGCTALPTSPRDLASFLEGNNERLVGIILVDDCFIADGCLSVTASLSALESDPTAAVAFGLGLPCVSSRMWQNHANPIALGWSIALRAPQNDTIRHRPQQFGRPLPSSKRVLSGCCVAVAIPEDHLCTDGSTFPAADILRACGASVIDAADVTTTSVASRLVGLYCDPRFDGKLHPSLTRTLVVDRSSILQVILGIHSWPEPDVSVSPPIAPAAPRCEREPSGIAASKFRPGEDYYAQTSLKNADEVILVRIEGHSGQHEVPVRVYRPLSEMRLLGGTRKPLSTVELSPTLRSIPVSSLIEDLPLFILSPYNMDHLYVLKGAEAPPGDNSNMANSSSLVRFRTHTPLMARPQDATSTPIVIAAQGASVERKPNVAAEGQDALLEFHEPLAATSCYQTASLENNGGSRRYFRSVTIHKQLIEIGTWIRFEHEPPVPAIPKLSGQPEPVQSIGEVLQIYKERDAGWVVVEMRVPEDPSFSGDTFVIPISAVLEIFVVG